MEGNRRGNHLLWIGPLVTLAGALSYFSFFARFAALRDFPWVNLPLVALGLALTVVAAIRPWRAPASSRGKRLGPIGVVVSAAIAIFFGAYVFAISSWVPAPSALTLAMEKAPDLASLAGYRGRSVVLVFYRGYW